MNQSIKELSDDPVPNKREVFIQIYNKFRSAIFNYVYYRVGDQNLADDITSEVFVRVVDSYDGKTYETKKIASWLYTIARNLVIDHYRTAGSKELSKFTDHFPAGESSNPVKQIDKRMTQDCLMVAMERLTEEQKQVILLKFVGRNSNQEISDLLGKSEGAIKSLQHRALASLRRVLEKEPCYEI